MGKTPISRVGASKARLHGSTRNCFLRANGDIALEDSTDADRGAVDIVLTESSLSSTVHAICPWFAYHLPAHAQLCHLSLRRYDPYHRLLRHSRVLLQDGVPVSFMVLIIALFNDGIIITLPIDRVLPSTTPDSWDFLRSSSMLSRTSSTSPYRCKQSWSVCLDLHADTLSNIPLVIIIKEFVVVLTTPFPIDLSDKQTTSSCARSPTSRSLSPRRTSSSSPARMVSSPWSARRTHRVSLARGGRRKGMRRRAWRNDTGDTIARRSASTRFISFHITANSYRLAETLDDD
ncbi:unnamed protein product [Peniophora sp. CBMAI 1063]|nr:unnamed protein product [Peniophora sp. CBMAI 1063]